MLLLYYDNGLKIITSAVTEVICSKIDVWQVQRIQQQTHPHHHRNK